MNGFHSITIFVIFAYIFIKFKSYLLLILQSEGMKCTSVTNTPDASNWIEEKGSNRQRSEKKHVYESVANDGSEFFLGAHQMFTQKSTLIFVQIEFCVFISFSSSLHVHRLVSCLGTGTTNGINARCAHTAFRNLNAIICVRDDDGWRAFYWNFYAGCWLGIMRRYLYLHTKHLTHTQNMQKWRRFKEKKKKKIAAIVFFDHSLASVEFWFCNLHNRNGFKMKIIFFANANNLGEYTVQLHGIWGMETITYLLIFFLFSSVSQHVLQIHRAFLLPVDESKSDENTNKIFIIAQKNVMHI